MNGTSTHVDTATLATLTPAVTVAKPAKRGNAKSVHVEKPAALHVEHDANAYLVRDSGSASGSSGSNQATHTCTSHRSVAAILEALVRLRDARDVSRFVLVSATLTTLDGTNESARDAWASASGHVLAAHLVPEARADGSHAHVHGVILFESDEHAARFVEAFRSAAGGDARACELREVTGYASFLRTGSVSVAWSGRGLEDDVRHVCAYAYGETRRKRSQNLTHGEPIYFGAFAEPAAVSAAPRVCACGCGRSLEGRRHGCHAFDAVCRSRVRDREHGRKKRATEASTRAPKRGTSTAPATEVSTRTPKRGSYLDECRDALRERHGCKRFGVDAAHTTLTKAQLVSIDDDDDREQVHDVLTALVQRGDVRCRYSQHQKRPMFRLATKAGINR